MILLLILLNFFTVSNQAKLKPIEPDNKLFSAFNEKLLNLPDVTVSFLDKNGFQIKLEAFKTAPNEAIIKNFDKESFGHLQWVSIGNPKLVFAPGTSVYFKWNHQYLSARVAMLEQEHTEVLMNRIKSKFKHTAFDSLDKSQVINMPLNQFICSLKLDCSGSDVTMVGYVKNFREYPLKLYFSTDYFERSNCSEKSLNNLNTQEQTLDCRVSMFGNKKMLTSLVIEENDYVKTYYSDRIFGNDQTKFVTRNQTIGIVKDWIKTNNMGAEEYSFTHQNIQYITDQLLEQIVVDDFEEISIETLFFKRSTYFLEPIPVEKIKETNFIQAALISKELFNGKFYFDKIKYQSEVSSLFSENFFLST